MNRKTVPIVVVLLLLGGAGFYFYKHHGNDGPSYLTQPVTRGRIVAKVTANGTVSPLVTVLVGSQISGQVAQLFATYNSVVKKGQVVAKLDTALLEAAVSQARANLLAAQGNLAKAQAQAVDAKRQAGRSVELAAKKLVAQADSDTADANWLAADASVKAAQGSVALAKASLDQAIINLRYATIYSPINGVVISRSVDVGQTVAAAMTAPTLFTIAEDLAKMQVDTSVAESDVGKITAGMQTTFTVDAYPNEHFKGKVRQIRNAPTTVQSVVTYDAVVDVENAELKLKPGMTANVSFIYAERKDVLKVPSAALRFKLDADAAPSERKTGERKGGKGEGGSRHGQPAANEPRTIYVLRGLPATPTPVSIHVGISDGSFVEVIDGDVSEKDQVVTDTKEDGKATPAGGSPPRGGPRPF